MKFINITIIVLSFLSLVANIYIIYFIKKSKKESLKSSFSARAGMRSLSGGSK